MYVIRYQERWIMKEVSIRKARKKHVCIICGRKILPNERYIRIILGNLYSKIFKYYALCLDCWKEIKNRRSRT